MFRVAVENTGIAVGGDQAGLRVAEESRFLFPFQVGSKFIEGLIRGGLSKEIADQDQQATIFKGKDFDGRERVTIRSHSGDL